MTSATECVKALGGPGAALLPVFRTRDSPFSYSCHGCGRCCHDKRIRVGPYEVARLAATLGVTTAEVLDRYVGEDGATLRTADDGACIFLVGRDCSVHGGRPLVCRTYPLGRFLSRDDGEEVIVELRPHPQSEGEYGPGDEPAEGTTSAGVRRATVADYFQAQGVPPYERAGRRYRAILERLVRLLESETTVAEDVPPLMDVDAAVRADCAARSVRVPDGVEQRVQLHLSLLERWLGRHEGD